ncbi:DUF3419 family protein [Dyadobacter luticola]|uniref:DUF3419 family protein n=1 Tax=Dyadobacter luticola TaxID=1979387 RepID=A0A5R9L3I5_9BACT|nr:DUF3419 family protein [Dyadobacter luticola]TLV02919.1 DUF3419 family protein [Dyadobacter luticola]
MSQKLTDVVDFGLIRYANCWEDADILVEALSDRGKKNLSIGSAGDNSFSLLTTDPELVVAVDINPTQLFLIELKKISIFHFELEETLAFLGFSLSEKRLKHFDLIKNQLSTEARAYWEANREIIEKGVIHAGKFEKYFRLFANKILPWIHSRKTVGQLLAPKSPQAQEDFYTKKWNTWRWRLLFKIFFSRYVMGKYGRDPEFLKQVDGAVSTFIFNKAAQHLRSTAAQRNYILNYNLTGDFQGALPHYLQEENYKVIRQNIGSLHLKQGFAQDAMTDFGRFHAMNLSDIFEYMDEKLFKTTSETLIKGMEKGGKLAYWNLMVPRRISAILPGKVEFCRDISENLSRIDKGFFYNQFILNRVRP